MFTKIKTWLAILGGLLAAVLAIWAKGRSDGKQAAQVAAKQEDHENAKQLEKLAADAGARPVDDPVSVLAKAGKLRD